ncbi:MAG: hypothetical protein M3P37_10230 [Actinomycetota bacterium]|nr:hypothetical protein [Actinomycetota bacterium]
MRDSACTDHHPWGQHGLDALIHDLSAPYGALLELDDLREVRSQDLLLARPTCRKYRRAALSREGPGVRDERQHAKHKGQRERYYHRTRRRRPLVP